MKYIISIFFSLLISLSLFFLGRTLSAYPYESLDDAAWEWKSGKKTVHLLAEDNKKDSKLGYRVLVDDGKNTRTWMEKKKLPHYYKLHCIDTEAKALISSGSVEEFFVGKSMDEIERSLCCATEYKGNVISFPVKVLTKGKPLSTQSVSVSFKDSVATAIDYTQAVDSTALLYSYVPGLFFFIDKGIKAPQNNRYKSNLAEQTKVKKKYRFGDLTVNIVSFLLKLALALIVLVIFLVAPALVVLPLAFLAMDIFDNWLGIAIGIVLEILVFILFAAVFLIFLSQHLWPMIVVGVICLVLTALFYKYELYD